MRRLEIRLIIVALSLTAGMAQAGTYNFTNLDLPGAFATELWGISSDATKIVGAAVSSSSGITGIAYSGGSFESVLFPNAHNTYLFGINNAGVAVGGWNLNDLPDHPFRYSQGVFDEQPGVIGSTSTSLFGINNAGHLVGEYLDTTGVPHGFLSRDGTITVIDVPGYNVTEALGLNDSDSVVGTYGTAFQFPNPSGQPIPYHGFVYSNGVLTTIDCPNAIGTSVYGINNRGDLSGTCHEAGQLSHGFVYSNGIFTTIEAPGAEDTIVRGISDSGQVVGRYRTAANVYHGFIATPVPIPGGLLAGALAAAASLRRPTQPRSKRESVASKR
jgi:hypothetical protein